MVEECKEVHQLQVCSFPFINTNVIVFDYKHYNDNAKAGLAFAFISNVNIYNKLYSGLYTICMFVLKLYRTTSDLENFQNHILMYAGKRFSFTPAVYRTRTLLAAIDYNCHNGRAPARNKDGHKM